MVFSTPAVLVAWHHATYIIPLLERTFENALLTQSIYFPDEKTRAQTVETICLKSHSEFVIELRYHTYHFSFRNRLKHTRISSVISEKSAGPERAQAP